MLIKGQFWKEDKIWVIYIPALDIATDATSKDNISHMAKDAIECTINDPDFKVDVTLHKDMIQIKANDTKKLIAFMLKQQRHKNNLTLEEVTKALKAKSINEYAQYEQGQHTPSIDKLNQFLEAINPEVKLFIS